MVEVVGGEGLGVEARERGLEMVCANPDIIVQRGDQTVYCGGALAQAYEAMGGRVVLCGKPHAPIYELALERLAGLRRAAAGVAGRAGCFRTHPADPVPGHQARFSGAGLLLPGARGDQPATETGPEPM